MESNARHILITVLTTTLAVLASAAPASINHAEVSSELAIPFTDAVNVLAHDQRSTAGNWSLKFCARGMSCGNARRFNLHSAACFAAFFFCCVVSGSSKFFDRSANTLRQSITATRHKKLAQLSFEAMKCQFSTLQLDRRDILSIRNGDASTVTHAVRCSEFMVISLWKISWDYTPSASLHIGLKLFCESARQFREIRVSHRWLSNCFNSYFCRLTEVIQRHEPICNIYQSSLYCEVLHWWVAAQSQKPVCRFFLSSDDFSATAHRLILGNRFVINLTPPDILVEIC